MGMKKIVLWGTMLALGLMLMSCAGYYSGYGYNDYHYYDDYGYPVDGY